MKKIIMAVAIVCAAVVAHASTFKWNAGTAFVVTPGATAPTAGITGTAYLLAATGTKALTQAALLDAVRGGQTVESLAAGLGASDLTVAVGKTTSDSAEFTYDSGNQSFYAVFVDSSDDSRIYISSATSVTGTDLSAATTVQIANQFAASKNAVSDGAYSGAGWYSLPSGGDDPVTPAIPEPTTGLLLLIGAAGLALRRKA